MEQSCAKQALSLISNLLLQDNAETRRIHNHFLRFPCPLWHQHNQQGRALDLVALASRYCLGSCCKAWHHHKVKPSSGVGVAMMNGHFFVNPTTNNDKKKLDRWLNAKLLPVEKLFPTLVHARYDLASWRAQWGSTLLVCENPHFLLFNLFCKRNFYLDSWRNK